MQRPKEPGLRNVATYTLILLTISTILFMPTVHGQPITMGSVGGGTCGPVAVCSWSQIGNGGILIVGISTDSAAGVQHVTSVTFGGFPLTWIARREDPNGNVLASMWYLMNSPPGSAQVQVTFASTPSFGTVGGSVTFSNVAGIGAYNTNNGLGSLASVSVNANSGDLVFGILTAGHQGSSPSPAENQLWNTPNPVLGAASDENVISPGPQTLTWSGLSPGNNWAMVAVDLRALSSSPPSCGFILSVAPTFQTVVAGQTANFALSVTPTNPSCIPSSVNFAVAGLGPGMNYEVTSSGIAITTDPIATPPGVYTITLLAGTQQAQMTLTVTAATSTVSSTTVASTTSSAFSFSLTVSPSTESVQNGASTSYVVSVVPVSGTSTPVSLTVTGLPASVSGSFTTPSGTPPYTSNLNVDLSASTASPGSYTLTVVATASGVVQTATATLIIQQASTTSSASSAVATTSTQSGLVPASIPLDDLIIAALVVIVIALAAFLMRGRGRKTAPTTQ